MSGTVPVLSIVCMAISCIVGFAIPIGLFFLLKKKASILPFFVGFAVMFIFALVLESLVHQVVLLHSPIGETIQNTPILYALYGGLMAGLFEETGRLVAFKTVLKKSQDKDVNALMYGAGHGGFEAVAILGLSMINNIIYSVLINTGNTDMVFKSLPAETVEQMKGVFQSLIETSSGFFLVGSFERLVAVVLQLSLSVLVWFAVKSKKGFLFPVAIGIHMVADAVVAYMSLVGVSIIVIEASIAVMTVATVFLARMIWKRNQVQSD